MNIKQLLEQREQLARVARQMETTLQGNLNTISFGNSTWFTRPGLLKEAAALLEVEHNKVLEELAAIDKIIEGVNIFVQGATRE